MLVVNPLHDLSHWDLLLGSAQPFTALVHLLPFIQHHQVFFFLASRACLRQNTFIYSLLLTVR